MVIGSPFMRPVRPSRAAIKPKVGTTSFGNASNGDPAMVPIHSTPYTSRMIETMSGLIFALAAIYFWQNSLKARDLARLLAQDLCAKAGVQLLDQSIALAGFGFARNAQSHLSLRRNYAFEVSLDGQDRHRGGLQMLDGRLLSWSLPVTHSQTLADGSNVIVMRRPEPPPRLH